LDSASTSDEAEMPNSDGFLVLCSIVDKQSLRHAEDIIVQTYRNLKETCGRIPIILVATKSDLHEGRYDFREVQRLAEKYYISHCYLTSASSGLNIQNAFVKLAEIVGYSYDEEFEKLENGESIIKLVENKKCNIT
jgi:GTPase SAR1 family protein